MDTYTLNIARLDTRADRVARYYHWALVQFGQCGPEVAHAKANLLKDALGPLGATYKFTLTCTPAPRATSTDL